MQSNARFFSAYRSLSGWRIALFLLASVSAMLASDALAQGERPHDRGRKRGPHAPGEHWRTRRAPVVEGFSPQSGPPGSSVVISGRHFDENTRVRFNGRWLRIIARTNQKLRVIIPASASSDFFVVSTPGFSDASSVSRFDVEGPAQIHRFFPPRGESGVAVTILGQNFLSTDDVRLAGQPMRVVSRQPGRITAIVPDGATAGPLSIWRGGREVATSRQPFVMQLANPLIRGFMPRRGAPGTVVTLRGANFSASDEIFLAGTRLPVRRITTDTIEVVINRPLSGQFVLQGAGGRRAIAPGIFAIVTPPRVERFAPHHGPPGTQIIIFGSGFIHGDQPYLGSSLLTVRTVTDNQIVAELPAGVSDGQISVKRGMRAYVARGFFRVHLAPTIESISPTAGPPGTLVTISGQHFGRRASVLMSGRKLPIRRRQPGMIQVEVLPGVPSGQMVVLTQRGTAQSTDTFHVQRYPALLSFFPLRGLAGTSVTLRGRHFHPAMRVIWSGRVLAPTSVTSDSAVVKIPDDASGSSRFTVTAFGRQQHSRLPFVVDQPAPELSFTIAPHRVQRGQEVTLFLTPARQFTRVYFNGRLLPKKSLEAGRRLVVTVPSDARSGYFEVEYRGRVYKANQRLHVY
ncbi:MAG: IPT/TIG domain-containing protein [Deltaproteobacteria bacterium]|nr:IPT/TIG domain-containing protein [Deltaproteobacteria bacterium]